MQVEESEPDMCKAVRERRADKFLGRVAERLLDLQKVRPDLHARLVRL